MDHRSNQPGYWNQTLVLLLFAETVLAPEQMKKNMMIERKKMMMRRTADLTICCCFWGRVKKKKGKNSIYYLCPAKWKESLNKYLVDSEILQYVNPKAIIHYHISLNHCKHWNAPTECSWKRKQVIPAYKCKTRCSNQWNLTALNCQVALTNAFLHEVFHQQPWCQVLIKIMLPIKQQFTYK